MAVGDDSQRETYQHSKTINHQIHSHKKITNNNACTKHHKFMPSQFKVVQYIIQYKEDTYRCLGEHDIFNKVLYISNLASLFT